MPTVDSALTGRYGDAQAKLTGSPSESLAVDPIPVFRPTLNAVEHDPWDQSVRPSADRLEISNK